MPALFLGRPAALLLAATLLAATLVASCAPSASPSPSPGAGTRWQPQTAWERAVVEVGDDGTYSKDAALALFATAYGPLPGVDVQQDLHGVEDRTIAIEAVARHRDALTDEQRTAIDAYLAPPADAIRIEIPPVAAMSPWRLVADAGLEQAIREVAEQARMDIAAKIGDHDGSMYIYFKPRPADVQPIGGIYPNGGTVAEYDGGLFNGCNITIYDEATAQSGLQLTALMTHEVMHCFQAAAHGDVATHNNTPDWINEGMATWVGMELGGPSPNYERFWDRYLLEPQIPLTERAYDAVGFYAHLKESGIDPWGVIRPMLAAGTSSLDAYRAAGADAEEFVDSWASSVLRQGGAGNPWDTTGPGITPTAYKPGVQVIGNGTSLPLGQPFFTNDIVSYALDADFVEIQVEGHARLRDGAIDTPLHGSVLYCVRGHDCSKKACDDGGDPPDVPGIAPRIELATSGGSEGLVGRIRGFGADERPDCSPPPSARPSAPASAPPTAPPDRSPCANQCGESNGDVHISTFGSSGSFDFQAIGEFVLARSADGQFEVQTRQASLGNSKAVSINTAMAVRSGSHRMAMYIDPATTSVRLTVDGAEMPFVTDTPVAFGDGLVIRGKDGVRIDTGGDGHVYVIGMSYRGFNLLVEPSASQQVGLAGLMGANPKDSRWPALPDGSAIVPVTFDRHDAWQQLYVTLADAWRVTPASSLFDYGPGESTETFTRRSFPAESDLISLEELSPAQRAAGEEACANVADPNLHKMCVYDVGVTADPGYGEIYEQQITLLETGSLGQSGERLRVVNVYANEGVGTAIDVYAWAGDAMNLGTGSATAPALVATVPFGESSAWFNPGKLANGPFTPVNWISIQRHGDPINSWRLNLFDLERDSVDGLSRVLMITGDPDGFAIGGGTAMSYSETLEEAPDGYFPLIHAPAGKALGFLDATSMYELDQPSRWAVSIDGRCLTDPDFPTLAQIVQGTGPRPVVIDPGAHQVAIHAWPPDADGFDLDCGRFPTVASTSVDVAAGDRVHLILFAERLGSPPHVLALPVGG